MKSVGKNIKIVTDSKSQTHRLVLEELDDGTVQVIIDGQKWNNSFKDMNTAIHKSTQYISKQ